MSVVDQSHINLKIFWFESFGKHSRKQRDHQTQVANFLTKALEKLEHHFWLITLPSRIRCIGDSLLARTINWCNVKLSIYLLTYKRVFGFMVVRGVCKYYWPNQNEPQTAHFSWPWWVMISTFQLDKSSHFPKKAIWNLLVAGCESFVTKTITIRCSLTENNCACTHWLLFSV